jgi:hypothetical protein
MDVLVGEAESKIERVREMGMTGKSPCQDLRLLSSEPCTHVQGGHPSKGATGAKVLR